MPLSGHSGHERHPPGHESNQAMKATSGSYNIAKQVHIYEDATRPVCPIQFYSKEHNYDYRPHEINVNVFMLHKVHTISKGLTGSDLTFSNCTCMHGLQALYFDLLMQNLHVYKMIFKIEHMHSC